MAGWRVRALAPIAALIAVLAIVQPASAAGFFGTGAVWNQRLPAHPQIDPSSSRIVSGLALWIGLKSTQREYPGIATDRFSTPVYTVDASTAPVPVVIDPGAPWQSTLVDAINANNGIPLPGNAQPAGGTNGHITVYDSSADTLYELYHASSPSMNATDCVEPLPWGAPCHRDGQWHADWGGLMANVGTSSGFFSVDSWPGLTGTEGYNWGATATSLPLLGGLITFKDLDSGTIDHALAGAFAGVKTCANYFVFPAQREDGLSIAPDCLPEGARLQLDPAYDVNADSNPPLTKAIERAAQTYGIVIRDKTADTFSFYGQDPSTVSSNPYTTGPGVGGVANGGQGYFGGVPQSFLFRRFPWSRLRVIAGTRCTAKPCGTP